MLKSLSNGSNSLDTKVISDHGHCRGFCPDQFSTVFNNCHDFAMHFVQALSPDQQCRLQINEIRYSNSIFVFTKNWKVSNSIILMSGNGKYRTRISVSYYRNYQNCVLVCGISKVSTRVSLCWVTKNSN